MIQAIQQKIRIQVDGRLEIVADELQAGMEADVIVLFQPPQSFIGDQTELSDVSVKDRLEALSQAQEIVCRHVPEGHSLVDELIAERRMEKLPR